MARVPIEAGFFAIPDDPADLPRLLGSRCPACDEVFFPRRLVCAQCLHEGTDDVELSTRGQLWTWTYCHVPMFGRSERGRVGATGSARSTCPRVPASSRSSWVGRTTSPSAWRWRSTSRRCGPTDDGDEVVIYRFRPVGAASDTR